MTYRSICIREYLRQHWGGFYRSCCDMIVGGEVYNWHKLLLAACIAVLIGFGYLAGSDYETSDISGRAFSTAQEAARSVK